MHSESEDESTMRSGDSFFDMDSQADSSSSYQAHSERPSIIEGTSTPCQDQIWSDEKENTAPVGWRFDNEDDVDTVPEDVE